MRVAIIGSRSFNDYEYFQEVMDEYIIGEIVSGGAKGADAFAEKYAYEEGFPTTIFHANWRKHGKAAGFIRNAEIWDYAECGVAFWDGKSTGTAHSFKLARSRGKLLDVYNYNTEKLDVKNSFKP